MMGLLDQSPYAMMGAQPFQQHPFGLLQYGGMQGGHMPMQAPGDIQKPKGLLDYAMGLGSSPMGAMLLSQYLGGGSGGGAATPQLGPVGSDLYGLPAMRGRA